MWTYSPRFDTRDEAEEWASEHPNLGVTLYQTYQTRKAKKWRARFARLDVGPVFSRDALLFIDAVH